ILASPVLHPCSRRHSCNSSGPAARWIAPSTPPPPNKEEFAALTMASSASVVMSAWMARNSTTRSIAMKVKAVAVEVFDRELHEAPRFFLERLGDVRAERLHVAVHVVDLRRMHPVDRGLEGRLAAAQEDRGAVAVDRADLLARIQPAYVEPQIVAIVLLRTRHVRNRQFGHRCTKGVSAAFACIRTPWSFAVTVGCGVL